MKDLISCYLFNSLVVVLCVCLLLWFVESNRLAARAPSTYMINLWIQKPMSMNSIQHSKKIIIFFHLISSSTFCLQFIGLFFTVESYIVVFFVVSWFVRYSIGCGHFCETNQTMKECFFFFKYSSICPIFFSTFSLSLIKLKQLEAILALKWWVFVVVDRCACI